MERWSGKAEAASCTRRYRDEERRMQTKENEKERRPNRVRENWEMMEAVELRASFFVRHVARVSVLLYPYDSAAAVALLDGLPDVLDLRVVRNEALEVLGSAGVDCRPSPSIISARPADLSEPDWD